MFRMVLLPQPEGPSSATNSPSPILNEASSTATTSPPAPRLGARKLLRSPLMSMRQRVDVDSISGGIFRLRGLEELALERLLELDRLDARELAVPDLLAAGVGVGRDHADRILHGLQLGDLELVGLGRGAADIFLDRNKRCIDAALAHELRGAPDRVGERLDLLGFLLDRLLQ